MMLMEPPHRVHIVDLGSSPKDLILRQSSLSRPFMISDILRHHLVRAFCFVLRLVYLMHGFLVIFLPMGLRRARALPRLGGCHAFWVNDELGRFMVDVVRVADDGRLMHLVVIVRNVEFVGDALSLPTLPTAPNMEMIWPWMQRNAHLHANRVEH